MRGRSRGGCGASRSCLAVPVSLNLAPEAPGALGLHSSVARLPLQNAGSVPEAGRPVRPLPQVSGNPACARHKAYPISREREDQRAPSLPEREAEQGPSCWAIKAQRLQGGAWSREGSGLSKPGRLRLETQLRARLAIPDAPGSPGSDTRKSGSGTPPCPSQGGQGDQGGGPRT